MSWLKIDDQFPDHPKVVEAGPLASWLHVCGMAYCARYLTDGFIPGGQVKKLADVDDAPGLAEKLLKAGLWDRVDSGFQVHDYLKYNPSAEQVKATRKARAESGRIGGLQSARSKEEANSQASAEANTQANAPANEKQSDKQNSTPSPSPSPSPNPVPKEESATPPPKRRRKRKTDPRTQHPAIQTVREVTNRYPPKPIWDDIIKLVGDSARIEDMRLCFKEGVKLGFKPTNFAWLFDWYVSGIPPRIVRRGSVQDQTAEAMRQFMEDDDG